MIIYTWLIYTWLISITMMNHYQHISTLTMGFLLIVNKQIHQAIHQRPRSLGSIRIWRPCSGIWHRRPGEVTVDQVDDQQQTVIFLGCGLPQIDLENLWKYMKIYEDLWTYIIWRSMKIMKSDRLFIRNNNEDSAGTNNIGGFDQKRCAIGPSNSWRFSPTD